MRVDFASAPGVSASAPCRSRFSTVPSGAGLNGINTAPISSLLKLSHDREGVVLEPEQHAGVAHASACRVGTRADTPRIGRSADAARTSACATSSHNERVWRAAAIIVVSLLLGGCSRQRVSLPVYDHVPPFVLTAQTGESFNSTQALKGKIWVADFIFTTCMGPCPRLTQTMRWVQKQTGDVPDVHFVSFTVDPKNDTPPVLTEYARRFNADTANWSFLTGPMDALNHVGRHSLKVNEIDGELSHSTRFVLVDRRGNIRGYYDTGAEGELDKLVAAIREIAGEPS